MMLLPSSLTPLLPYFRLMSIALTIPDTAALLEAVAMLSEDTRLVDKLWGNVEYLNKV